MSEEISKFRQNNFDMIRLGAALAVALVHGSEHLDVDLGLVTHWLRLVPGVPVFFFISGFLISRSYENNSRLREYGVNRALRIFPALIVCSLVALCAVIASGYLESVGASIPEIIVWLAGQVTFVQFFNPEFMRGFGVGVLNGSLWTISVELQFYLLIPILYWMLERCSRDAAKWNWILIALVCLFAVVNQMTIGLQSKYSAHLWHKLLKVSFVPWVYMFFVGILAQRNFASLARAFAGRAWLSVPVFVVFSSISAHYFDCRTGNFINPALFLLLSVAVFSCAYTLPSLSGRILKRNDISYGVYIYHMPIINFMIYHNWSESPYSLFIVIGLTFAAAIASWVVIERPALSLKKCPLFSVGG